MHLDAQCDTAERVWAVIPNASLKSGFMGVKSKRHTLILTDRRVIFARSTVAMIGQRVADARDRAKSEGKGLFGQLGAQVSANWRWADRYLLTPPEQALAETADNFAVARSVITNTSLKTKIHGSSWSYSQYEEYLLVIKARDRKYKIVLHFGRDRDESALRVAGMI